MMGPDSIKWLDAIKSAIVSIYENQVWNLVDPPEGMMPIEHKWIYKETDVDVHIHYKESTCHKDLLTKFKELTTIRLTSYVAML